MVKNLKNIYSKKVITSSRASLKLSEDVQEIKK